MSADKRPGGLTALAVVNFILGALSILAAVGLPAMLALVEQAAQNMTEQQRAQVAALGEIGSTLLMLLVVANLISGILSIASGVGYLKLKKFLGRTIGNVGAVYSIGITVASVVGLPPAIGGGFNLMVLLTLLYSVITLFLLNVTFKEDLVN